MSGNLISTAGGGTSLGFNKKFAIPGGNLAAGIELPSAKDPAVLSAFAHDTPFPNRPLELSEFSLSAEGGHPIEFGRSGATVKFSGSASAFTGLGVFREGAGVLESLPFSDSLERSIRFAAPGDDMYMLMKWGYDLEGSAKGSMALGLGGKATFGVDARREGVYAVVRRIPASTGARAAVADVVHSWVLPRQIHEVADLQPGTWVIAEVDGSLNLKVGAEFGYDFSWSRETKLGGLKQDIGLRLQLRAKAALTFEASGKYAVVVSRESTNAAETRVRLQVFKQSKRGMTFPFNADAVAAVDMDLPPTVDEFVMAIFDLHPTQLIDDLHAIENWLGSDQPIPDKLAELGVEYGLDLVHKITGVDPEQEFDKARARVLGLFSEWDKLPERVSSTLWKLVEEKAAGIADLAALREVVAAVEQDAPATFRTLVEKQLASIDFFRSPVGRWLEAAATDGLLSVITDGQAFRQLQGLASATSKLLDPLQHGATLENLQTEFERRLGLDRVRKGLDEADFAKVDGWLKKKLGEFLGRKLDFPALQEIREAVVDILNKRNDFYAKAQAALSRKYAFTFASAYEQATTRTALIDADFDLSDPTAAALFQEGIDGDFKRLFIESHPGVTLRTAALTHGINRTQHVELHLPKTSRITDHLNTALARVEAVEDDGRLLVYDLKASDLVTEKNRRNSRLAVRAAIPVRKGQGIRVRGTESLGYSYTFRQSVKKMRGSDARAQLVPYLQTYFASSFRGDSSPSTWIADLDKQIDQVEFNGTENFGNTLLSLELGVPAAVAAGWLNTPSEKKAEAYMRMSRAIQAKLKELIPFYFFADLENLEEPDAAAPLLVYAAIPPTSQIRLDGQSLTINPDPPRGVYWDVENSRERKAMIGHSRATASLTVAVQRLHERLNAAGRTSLAKFYAPGQLSTLRSRATAGTNSFKLESLLRMESNIVAAAHHAGLQMAAFRERQWDDPEGAVEALAKFGSSITDAFNHKVKSIYGGAALRPLGTMVFVEAARAFLPPAVHPPTSALLELTVLKEGAAFDLSTFLDGKQPPHSEVVIQQRLARI